MKKDEFIVRVKRIKSFYGELVDNIEEEGLVWFNIWKDKEIKDNMDFVKLLEETTFFPLFVTCSSKNYRNMKLNFFLLVKTNFNIKKYKYAINNN